MGASNASKTLIIRQTHLGAHRGQFSGIARQLLPLMPVTRDVLVATLCTSHSATGRIDEARVRAALPEDKVLSSISPTRPQTSTRSSRSGSQRK
ncbi:hypothetical protein [Frigidibacter oleivorans]|uniref:hypothetical protein n=1 Tax=Frigidibacter oleivorans TaxID=2487129 RepID=UPI000F8D1125|nr:hypothetical protein [Frigidibacter oleivorans]